MDYFKMKLYLAIKYNDYNAVVNILRRFDLSKNEFFDDKVTYVQLAILQNNFLIAQTLIENGADVNRISYLQYDWPQGGQQFNSFEPALITATRHGNYKICELLLAKKAKINKQDSFSMSALHWAVSLNLINIVKLLLDNNVNYNLLDHKNQTAIHRAIKNSNEELVRLFADKVSLEFKFREYLLTAIKFSNCEILHILLDQISKGKVKFDLNLIDESDSVGTLLHHAVILSNLAESTRLQMRRNRRQRDGRSEEENKKIVPYSKEIFNHSKVKIVENLIDFGKAEINIVNRLGETPLHMCRNIQVGRLLLDKGAVMNICEITGKMPLFTYILSAHYDMCVEMLKNGCNLENIDRLGNSLFQVLIKSNAPLKLILLLLEAGIAFEKEEWVRNKEYTKVLIEKYPKLVSLIDFKLRNPPSLKEIARKSLRSHLNRINKNKSIVNSVLKLDKIIPTTLQDYILLNLNKKYEHLLIK